MSAASIRVSRSLPCENFFVSALTFSNTSSRLSNRVFKVVVDGEMRRIQYLVQRLERAHGDGDIAAILGLVDAERRLHARMADAGIRPHEILAEIEHGDIFLIEMRQHAGEQVHLDLLALAGLLAIVERRQDAVDHVHRADLIGEARTRRNRGLVAAAGVGNQAGQPLDQHVLTRPFDVGTLLAVTGAGAVDDAAD